MTPEQSAEVWRKAVLRPLVERFAGDLLRAIAGATLDDLDPPLSRLLGLGESGVLLSGQRFCVPNVNSGASILEYTTWSDSIPITEEEIASTFGDTVPVVGADPCACGHCRAAHEEKGVGKCRICNDRRSCKRWESSTVPIRRRGPSKSVRARRGQASAAVRGGGSSAKRAK